MYVMQWFICVTMRGRYALQADTSNTSLMREHNNFKTVTSVTNPENCKKVENIQKAEAHHEADDHDDHRLYDIQLRAR